MCPQPFSYTTQNTGEHSTEDDSLKRMNDRSYDKESKESTQMIRRNYRTNQNLIAQPGNGDIQSTGCQDKSIPESSHKFATPT